MKKTKLLLEKILAWATEDPDDNFNEFAEDIIPEVEKCIKEIEDFPGIFSLWSWGKDISGDIDEFKKLIERFIQSNEGK